ncbi:MAG TPA: hypothetical protein VKB78_12900, partial [Pirellulales bacterium]|nr:hypothetical protein [Pirellulales bacterium]
MTADELHLLETATHSEASRNDTVSAWTGTAGEQFRLSAYPSSAGENNGGGDLTADWDKWRRHLLRRNRTKLLRQLARDRCSMLRWNWREDDAGRIGLLLDVLEHRAGKRGANRKSLKSTSQEWLSPRERRNRPIVAAGADASLQNGTHGAPHFENGSVACSLSSDGGQSKVAAAFESLAWLHLLADRVELFNGKLWRQVWHTLREEAHNPPPAIEADALAHQLAAAELPLTIAYLFPELARGSSLMIAAAAAISHCMTELLDAEGMPHCRYLGVFPALAASWTRCRLIAEQLDGSGWPNDCERRFPLILQAAVRLER